MQAITARELKAALDSGAEIQIIDVRQPDEFAFASIEGSKLIPLAEIISRMNELAPDVETVVMCRSGMRSARAIDVLARSGFQGVMKNLTGGILAWSDDVDPSIPKY